MPKSTFFNISEEKQKRIIDIAIEELTTKSFELVHVNSIIKKADISRGSFYTYFEDLDELFNYLMLHVRDERLKFAQKLIKECNRDYFVFIKNLFIHDFDSFMSKSRYTLFRNYIFYIQLNKKGSLKNTFISPLNRTSLWTKEEFDSVFDYKKYGMSIDEFFDLIEITMIIMIDTFMKSESEELSKEEVIALFNKRMKIIEYGVLRK